MGKQGFRGLWTLCCYLSAKFLSVTPNLIIQLKPNIFLISEKLGLFYELLLLQLIFFFFFGVAIYLHSVTKAVGNKSLEAFPKLPSHETDFTNHLLCEGHIRGAPHSSKASAHPCKSLLSQLHWGVMECSVCTLHWVLSELCSSSSAAPPKIQCPLSCSTFSFPAEVVSSLMWVITLRINFIHSPAKGITKFYKAAETSGEG